MQSMASSVSYSVKLLPDCSGWSWAVKADGVVVASGVAATMLSARETAIGTARKVDERKDAGTS
jgi:hypothetical protein